MERDMAQSTQEECPSELAPKLSELEGLLRSYGSAALGYSGGVDSTFLAAVLARCMPDRALLVHLGTAFVGTPERASYEREATRFGLPVLEVDTEPLANEKIAANPADRCYWCKRTGFARIVEEARARGYAVVLEGSNADDPEASRPGMRATRELGVRAPLREAGWHKNEERALLRAWGIETWSLPADACLATRIPCGERLTLRKLETVRACEDHLHELGLGLVRVRLVDGETHVQAAPADLAKLAALCNGEGEAGGSGNAGGEGADAAGEAACRLPPSVVEAFLGFGARAVAPVATPYRYGSMSAPDRQPARTDTEA